MKPRVACVDQFRGAAIVTMVAANLAGEVLIQPHPFLLRLCGSFAAPMFILVSGALTARGIRASNHRAAHTLARAALLLATAAVNDLIFGICPFVVMDVLYLIGASLPLAHLAARSGPCLRWALPVAIFALTPGLQALLGYSPYPPYYYLGQEPVPGAGALGPIARSWLVDGWFPLFPWAGFSTLGAALAAARPESIEPLPAPRGGTVSGTVRGAAALPAGAALVFLGAAVWRSFPGPLYVREGYSELFYPPTPGYVLTAAGVAITLLILCCRFPEATGSRFLRVLGEAPLLFYLLQGFLIVLVIQPLAGETDMPRFAVTYLALLAALAGIGLLLRRLKGRWPERPFIARFFLG